MDIVATLVPIVAIGIFLVAGFLVVRGMMGFGRTANSVSRVLDIAMRNAELKNCELSAEGESEEAIERIKCQFCGGTSLSTQTQCKGCGAPLE